MCGIFFSLRSAVSQDDGNETSASNLSQLLGKLQLANAARGPDAQETVHITVQRIALTFFASELRLRGEAAVAQPHIDPDGNVLCWNGEIFEGMSIAPDENDGKELSALLQTRKTPEEIRDVLGSIEGPYAVVYYQKSSRRIYFARDPLGRRSLLIHKPTRANPYFLLTSVSAGAHPAYNLEELPTEQIYCLDAAELGSGESVEANFQRCFETIPRHGYELNVPFVSYLWTKRFPFSLPSILTYAGSQARLPKVNVQLPDDPPMVQDLDHIPAHLSFAVDELTAHLDRSVMLRVRNIPRSSASSGQAKVAVLFSGGIDSTMLAFLASRHVDPDEPIDLLNVAFENPRKISVQVEGNIGGLPKREKKQKLRDPLDYSTVQVSYDVPDRLTGLKEVEELRRLCPARVWNFVEINVPYEESQGARSIVEALMFPGRTVMDLSLAVALYFAARGVGQVRSCPGAPAQPYTTPARVLLNGLGSDELLGGYGRHRTAFKAAGWQAIVDELQLELDRIPTRNLGRDDRVISSHGKETRHPFLSLSVVSFLARLPVHMKTDPRLEAGLGEKLLLRLAARKVGLIEASARKKRAMQFGSHSARMIPGEGDRKGDLLLNR
ncbi:asparagine synthase-domain-containing protein [Sparassis latifolia]